MNQSEKLGNLTTTCYPLYGKIVRVTEFASKKYEINRISNILCLIGVLINGVNDSFECRCSNNYRKNTAVKEKVLLFHYFHPINRRRFGSGMHRDTDSKCFLT